MNKKKRKEIIGISAIGLLFFGCLMILILKEPKDFNKILYQIQPKV